MPGLRRCPRWGRAKRREVRAAWDYYLPYTTHDSSLSPAVHGLIALRLGMMDQAVEFWPGYEMEFQLSGGREFRIFRLDRIA